MVPDSGASDSGTELDTMMRVSIHESIIPAFKEWCQVLVWRRLLGTKTDKKLGVRNVPISLVE